MSPTEYVRYLGVVADGSTDQQILSQLVRCLLENGNDHRVVIKDVRLGQSLVVYMDTFREAVSRTGNYGLGDAPARDLRNGIITVLHSAMGEFQSQLPRELRDCDLLVLNTDSERHLNSSAQYFEDWAVSIPKIFLTAIEEFYHQKAQHGWSWEYLPMILPLVLFPSTDILVAAAREENFLGLRFRGMPAWELKQDVYGVRDLRHLRSDEFQEKALNFITLAACTAIYAHLPESRIFFRTLAWNQTIGVS